MTKDQIPIVTRMDDAYADDVILVLQEMGHEPVRLNTDDIPSNTTMSLGLESGTGTWTGSIKIRTRLFLPNAPKR